MAIPGGWRVPAAVLVVVATAVGVYAVVSPDPPPPTPVANRGLGQSPSAQFALVSGEGQGLVQAYCTGCHTLAPIVTHTGLTQKRWAKTVEKMRKNYGAPIDDTTAAAITVYLQQNYASDLPALKGTALLPYPDPQRRPAPTPAPSQEAPTASSPATTGTPTAGAK